MFIDGKEICAINDGFLIFLGVEKNDEQKDLNYMVKKTIGLRIIKDDNSNMNLSLQDVDGEALVVSQFTLCANTRKGRRPSFINAAQPIIAENIYNQYCERLRNENISVKTGQFGVMMNVELVNAGPVTLILDSRK